MNHEQQPDLWAAYNGTGGFVARPASRERAIREVQDGTLSARQKAIRVRLATAGRHGMTWKELGDLLGLHHGSVSGALSNLHKMGAVFMLREQRDRCHPYVHAMYRDWFAEDERYDEPVRTKRTQRNDLLEELLNTCREAVENGWSASMQQAVTSVVSMLDEHDNINAQKQD